MIVRCDSHPSIRQPEYRHRVDPVGYPSTAAICGIGGCANPGRILLKDPEWKAYQEGKRDFGANNNFTKVRAVGSPVPVAAPAEDLHRKSRTSPVPFLKRIFTQTFLVKESQMNSRSGAIPGQIRSISVSYAHLRESWRPIVSI